MIASSSCIMNEEKIQIYQFTTNPVCSPYRFDFPREQLNRRENVQVTKFTKLDAAVYAELVEYADMLIIQRLPMSPRLAKVYTALNSRGKLVIFEIDDDLLHLHPESRYAKQAPPDYRERIEQSLLASQAVQCSTQALANVISQIHPEVVVLENQFDKLLPYNSRKKDGGIIIGYAAGEDHFLDWLTIKDAYNTTIVQLELEGFQVESWIIGDKAIFESIASKNKRYFPLLQRSEYLQLLQQVDISLIPLADIPFNRSKSDVKFLESAGCGAAVLASKFVYSNSLKNGETGILFSNADEFANGLTELVRSQELTERLSRNAQRYVSENRLIEQHVERWEEIYLSWVSNRDKLLRNLTKIHS